MPRDSGSLLATLLAVLLDAPYFSSCCAPERRTRGLAIDLLGKRERRLIQEVSSELRVASGLGVLFFATEPLREATLGLGQVSGGFQFGSSTASN